MRLDSDLVLLGLLSGSLRTRLAAIEAGGRGRFLVIGFFFSR
jgi:hypothetical protein